MKDDIKKDITSIYNKIQKDTAENLKEYKESIKDLEDESKRFWAFTGGKEAIFWCMCLSLIVFIGRSAFDLFGVQFPIIVWQIAHVCSFIPFIGFIIGTIIEIAKGNK